MIDKAGVVEKILSHIGLWVENERGPPAEIKHVDYEEVTREPFLDARPERSRRDWSVNERAEKYA